ncbi:Glycosyltransferase involved in cell wall bisynthesis [Kandleria vitulina]|uniref:glycosyltransferase family 2 protein n=1 Tax=Kandleria vitulina TaxID=1630 RepID=UPI0008830316|nr:glycosyltransferase [Kandleria vitulina]SDM17528.1 Glycosyltransferase involved in cell wall bisynthesis [Kandleria vitulina]
MKVSVIIPVYNSEKYVRTAVESILKDSLDDFEIMLIDDGSTDSSGSICDDLQNEYSKIVAYHKPNGGMCSARNFALQHARGEYVTFMDNDDLCHEGFVGENYEIAKKYNADIVRFGREYLVLDHGKTIHRDVYHPKKEVAYYDDDIYNHYEEIRESNGVWTGMYRKSFLDEHNIRFDETLRHGHEDTLFNLSAYENAKTIAMNPKSYYVWMRRYEHSSSAKFNQNRLDGIYKALKVENELMTEKGVRSSYFDVYSRRIMNYTLESIISGFAYGNTCTYSQFKKICKRAVKIINNTKIEKKHLDFKTQIIFVLLKLRFYFVLYCLYKYFYKG